MDSRACFATPNGLPHMWNKPQNAVSRCSSNVCAATTARMSAFTTPSKGDPSTTDRAPEAAVSTQPPPFKVRKAPSHWRLPVVGPLIDVTIGNTGPKLAQKYGPIYRSTHFVGDALIVTKHSTVCAVQKQTALFTSRHSLDTMKDLFGYEGLLALDGDEHSKQKSMYSPLFATQSIKRLFNFVRDSADNTWETISKRLTSRPSQPVDIEAFIGRHFLRVVLAVINNDLELAALLSVDTDSSTPNPSGNTNAMSSLSLSAIVTCFETIVRNLYLPKFPPVVRGTQEAVQTLINAAAPILCDRLENDADIIEALRTGSDEKIAAKAALLSQQMDFITVIAAQSGIPTGSEFLNNRAAYETRILKSAQQIIGFFVAGFVTTAPTLLSCLYRILQDSSLYIRIVDEQRKIPELTFQAVNEKMPLLSSVLYETLRFHPSVHVMTRHAKQDTYLEGCLVHKGEAVVLDVWAANQDPAVFKNPHIFDSERFMPRTEEKKSPTTSSVLTFGAHGTPHYCLGAQLAKMEIKVTIAELIRNYDVDVVKSDMDNFEVIPMFKPRVSKFEKCTPRSEPM